AKPMVIAVNKSESVQSEIAEAEFHVLGLATPVGISAAHGQGIEELLTAALAPFPADEDVIDEEQQGPKIAVIGRPNVGKSTLINRVPGEKHLLPSTEPGTTRDSVY